MAIVSNKVKCTSSLLINMGISVHPAIIPPAPSSISLFMICRYRASEVQDGVRWLDGPEQRVLQREHGGIETKQALEKHKG